MVLILLPPLPAAGRHGRHRYPIVNFLQSISVSTSIQLEYRRGRSKSLKLIFVFAKLDQSKPFLPTLDEGALSCLSCERWHQGLYFPFYEVRVLFKKIIHPLGKALDLFGKSVAPLMVILKDILVH